MAKKLPERVFLSGLHITNILISNGLMSKLFNVAAEVILPKHQSYIPRLIVRPPQFITLQSLHAVREKGEKTGKTC